MMVRAATVRRNDEATTEMANIPQKSPDPTEEALTAIREALDTNQPERRAALPATPTGESDLAQTQPSATADLSNEEPQAGSWDSDGSQRALARAAELESLVHNEVSALERAYNDNEVRIRDLLSELTNQRETLVNQAEHVRNAIASVHLDLSHDITSVGDLVSDKVNEVAQRVTRVLTEKGEHITMALGQAGDSMIDTLTERGATMLDRL